MLQWINHGGQLPNINSRTLIVNIHNASSTRAHMVNYGHEQFELMDNIVGGNYWGEHVFQ